MPLSSGSRLGAYEIVAAIGAGGMGEVYRARDTKLNRDVALKILPEAFTLDGDRIARFRREAQVLAALNCPNIASIYGFEDSGSTHALVLELVEGPTLADRLAEGPVPIDEALPIARQIADALEAAHEQGIIHRDLKPGNIKVRADGAVKVLDFGLAKAFDPTPASSAAMPNSPTLSMQATIAGVILGTAAYMSPEQASGKTVDKRTDIWSFGVVFWEMLTGKSLFAAETISHTLADVLRAPIDVGQLPPDTPLSIRDLLQRCLDRVVGTRLRDIGEARIAIDHAAYGSKPSTAELRVPQQLSRSRRVLPWAIATGSLGIAIAILVLWAPWRRTTPESPLRLIADMGVDASLGAAGAPGTVVALSPDGKFLAFIAQTSSGGSQLYVRRLDQLQATALPGTDDARNPFFSPNGQWIGFFTRGKLKKVAVTGGAPIAITDSLSTRGGAWGDDGTIAFTPNGTPGATLLRVPEAGGTPEPLTKQTAGEGSHRWPQFLPGKAVLFTVSNGAGYDDANIVAQRLPDG